MMRFTFEHPKQFKRISTRLQGVFQNPDIWFPWNSKEETIKSVSSQKYEIVTSSVKDILIGERTLESRNGSVYYKVVLFAENVCYQDRFLVFEKDLMTLLEYFSVK